MMIGMIAGASYRVIVKPKMQLVKELNAAIADIKQSVAAKHPRLVVTLYILIPGLMILLVILVSLVLSLVMDPALAFAVVLITMGIVDYKADVVLHDSQDTYPPFKL